MNDKDKEAFENHLDEMIGSGTTRRKFYGGEGSGTVAATRTAWAEACRYKQKEIDILDRKYTEDVTYLDTSILKIQSERKKLREALEHESNKRKILQEGMEFIVDGRYYTEHVAEETLEKLKELGEK